MPPIKRTFAVNEQQKLESENYKRKLRSYKSPKVLKALPPPGLSKKESKKYSIKNPLPQHFSFPENIIYYVARNPSAVKCHLNVIKSCKSIFRMSRIIPVKEVYNYSDGSMNIRMFNKRRKLGATDISLETPTWCKLWIYEHLDISWITNPNFASTMIKHLHKCTLRKITVKKQVLTFGELQFLTGGGKLEDIDFDKNVVKNNDGSIVEFEIVFEILFCKKMNFTFPLEEQHGIGKNTAAKIAEMLESKRKSHHHRLSNILEIFDFQIFSIFLKENMDNSVHGNCHKIDLHFVETLSAAYKDELKKCVNEILNTVKMCKSVPHIDFSDDNNEASKKLWRMRYNR